MTITQTDIWGERVSEEFEEANPPSLVSIF